MFKYINIILILLVQFLRVECHHGAQCYAQGQYGICKPLEQCPGLAAEIERAGKQAPQYKLNLLKALRCGPHGEICCTSDITGTYYSSVQNDGKKPELSEYSIYNSGSQGNANDIATQVVEDDNYGPKDIQNHPNLHLLPTKCGKMNMDSRIFGGQQADLFEMPWMVILSYRAGSDLKFACGGTLINERYVLTAAHCVPRVEDNILLDSVILGEYNLKTDPDCVIDEDEYETCAPRARNSSIEQVITHPGFSYEKSVDDIALIRLAQPANISIKSISPICLPLTRALQTESLVEKGRVAGWGFTETGIQSSVLLKVDLPFVSNEDCNIIYKGFFHISNKQICAGAIKGMASCGGDSGGPLIKVGLLGSNIQNVQRGLVSFGHKNCGSRRYPGVYTNVAYYMDWILDHIRP